MWAAEQLLVLNIWIWSLKPVTWHHVSFLPWNILTVGLWVGSAVSLNTEVEIGRWVECYFKLRMFEITLLVFCQRWVGCDPFDSGATWTPEEAVLHFMPQTFKPHVHSCFQYLSDVEEQWNIHKHERHHEPVFTFIRHLSAPHDLDSAARVPALTLSRCSDLRDVLIVQTQHEHTGTAADLPSHRFRSPCQELCDTQDKCCLYWLRSSQISWFHWLIQWIFVLDMD